MGFALRDSGRHTYADYLGWAEDERYALIDGLAWCMAPAPKLVHQEVAGEIYRQLVNALQSKPCRALIAPVDVRLPRARETRKWTPWCSPTCSSSATRESSTGAGRAERRIWSSRRFRRRVRATIMW